MINKLFSKFSVVGFNDDVITLAYLLAAGKTTLVVSKTGGGLTSTVSYKICNPFFFILLYLVSRICAENQASICFDDDFNDQVITLVYNLTATQERVVLSRIGRGFTSGHFGIICKQYL